ncbi:FecR family protein [Leeuwenhoekiella aestuarii]|uniref:FecR family protein n=1 Tax=Leeuwenhoekiella aestuarii TaxID=2249426 RepID=A0A4Q0NNK2_9FLAO|nr:FecR domain-containing protein [Leeuwenhoekiella aestuarii]RXG11541.1 FecR family protein [Leeuwenhoekiella aestuarii]RXG12058.1 FecR family protein [Leeuwenhoekiella aestuarii]
MENVDDLIQKFQNRCISDEELTQLEQWVKSSKRNTYYFKNAIEQDYLLTAYSRKDEKFSDFDKLLRPVKSSSRRIIPATLFKYAAILVLGIFTTALGYFYLTNQEEAVYNPGKITFTYPNGETMTLDESVQVTLTDESGNTLGVQKQGELDFTASKTQDTTYNTLNVPRGKRLNLLLADGSRVYLNSESTLRFPAHFPETGTREVYLTGEGFFEVAKDAQHPFRVNAEELQVEVLGTRFNVNAYDGAQEITTTLAEGSVKLVQGNQEAKLVPGEAGIWKANADQIEVSEVLVSNNTAWIENRLLFIDEPFETIVEKIERSYGVKIINNNPSLAATRFNGDFDLKTESVNDVLDAFTAIDFFEYSYKNNIITIK